MENIAYLAIDLPENIQKAKLAGDFAYAEECIRARMAGDCTEPLKKRLSLELSRIGQLRQQYPYTREEALAKMQQKVPGFTLAEFVGLELSDAIDFWYIDGKRMYFEDFASSLCIMHPELLARNGAPAKERSLRTEDMNRIISGGKGSRTTTLHAGVLIEDSAFVPGEKYTVHIPLPASSAQQSNIRILRTSHTPVLVADENAPQRTICFCKTLFENTEFFVEYSFDSEIVYFDCENPPKPFVLYPNTLPPTDADLAELAPHVRFTPYLKALAQSLRGDETAPLSVARAFYDYITKHVRYSYMREYLQIDDAATHAAMELRGDCGVQALLFIALCRLSGIPARWQSGLYCAPGDAGSHDWAQFYVPEYGWLFADPSFGGGGTRAQDEARRLYYFGNLETYRMVANSAYQADFAPMKQFLRADPFDNQCGEVETATYGLQANQFHRRLYTL